MSIKIQIPFIFQIYTNNLEIVEATGTTVGECFDDLVRKYPDIRKGFYNDDGTLTNLTLIYKNEDLSRQLSKVDRVEDRDTLIILPPGG